MAHHNYTPLPGEGGPAKSGTRAKGYLRRLSTIRIPAFRLLLLLLPILAVSLYLLHSPTSPTSLRAAFNYDYRWRITYNTDSSPQSLQADLNHWQAHQDRWNPFTHYTTPNTPPLYPSRVFEASSHKHNGPTFRLPVTGINRGVRRGQGKKEIKLFPYTNAEEANAQAERRIAECSKLAGWRRIQNRKIEVKATAEVLEEGADDVGSERGARELFHGAVATDDGGKGRRMGANGGTGIICGNNELKVAVLQSFWFVEGLKGMSTGEAVWAASIINSLHSQNYTLIFTSLGWLKSDMSLTMSTYQKYADLVKVVIADHPAVEECWADAAKGTPSAGCLKMAEREVLIEGAKRYGAQEAEVDTGIIPAWKLLTLSYWDHVANPLGPEWTLSPHMTNSNRFISYSIEPSCLRHSFVSYPLRPENRTYIFGKNTIYLVPGHNDTAWTVSELNKISEDLSLDAFVAMNENEAEASAQIKSSDYITNVGRLGPAEFRNQLATSRVFVGVGRPRISPSPFDALCLGVPFINPIGTYDKDDVWDRAQWLGQHWAMQELEPPYVYNVFAHDTEGLKGAIELAFANPIDSFIPEYMTFDFACDAIAAVMEDDWNQRYFELYRRA